MEELFEFLFGASGRINRAKYWRSLLIFCGAGLLVGVILLTAAASPHRSSSSCSWSSSSHGCFGASLSTLSDCMTAAKAHGGCWCSMRAGSAGQLAKGAWFAGAAGTGLHYVLALAGFALSIWGFVEIGCLRGNAGPNKYGSNPLSVPAARG